MAKKQDELSAAQSTSGAAPARQDVPVERPEDKELVAWLLDAVPAWLQDPAAAETLLLQRVGNGYQRLLCYQELDKARDWRAAGSPLLPQPQAAQPSGEGAGEAEPPRPDRGFFVTKV